uniref:Putative bZIP transcription factor 18 n=1 Tax=Davidia involucrata TaxID=16924 RepID=A0A5B7AY99_DAVIN
MGDPGVLDNEIMEPIDWGHMFDNIPEDLNFFDFEVDHPSLLSADGSVNEFSNPSPDSVSLSIGDIEHLLMKDDHYDEGIAEQPNLDLSNNFLSDILLDSPVESDPSGDEVVDASDGKNSSASEEGKFDIVSLKENINEAGSDPINKKRKRQLRNRDAAMRSRERKKMYVRDLEMKSRYLEGECRRLGMLLQCCSAENQALRLSLQNSKAFDASMTKQESAVLLLESLLLGSLLWFLGIICLLIQPRPLQSILESVDNKNQASLAPRKVGSKIFGLQLFQSFIMSKRCKASRSRMKPSLCTLIISFGF